jgi:hypothetical protein
MPSKKYQEIKANRKEYVGSEQPKHKQFIKMLTFRVVPAYYQEIEKVANHKKITVSKLIRSYIKEGMIKDKEITAQRGNEFIVEPPKHHGK